MPKHNFYCNKCEYEEKDLYVEWDDKKNEVVNPKCPNCGNLMGINYSDYNMSFKIKGWSPGKESKARRTANETQSIIEEGFDSKQEMAIGKAMYKEKYGDITDRDYGATGKEKKENMKKHAKEQGDKMSKDIKKGLNI